MSNHVTGWLQRDGGSTWWYSEGEGSGSSGGSGSSSSPGYDRQVGYAGFAAEAYGNSWAGNGWGGLNGLGGWTVSGWGGLGNWMSGSGWGWYGGLGGTAGYAADAVLAGLAGAWGQSSGSGQASGSGSGSGSGYTSGSGSGESSGSGSGSGSGESSGSGSGSGESSGSGSAGGESSGSGYTSGSGGSEGSGSGSSSGYAEGSGNGTGTGTGSGEMSGSGSTSGSGSSEGSGSGSGEASGSGFASGSGSGSGEASGSGSGSASGSGEASSSGSGTASVAWDGPEQIQSYLYERTGGDGSTRHYEQDATGGLETVTDALGHVTRSIYDAAGHKISVTVGYGATAAATTTFVWQGDLLVQVIDPNQDITTFGYDAQGRVVSMTDPLGHTATRSYDAQGRIASITNRNGLRREYAYDTAGRLTAETWYAGDGATVADTLAYTYDADGRLASASNSAGAYTFSYDTEGRLIRVSEPFGVSLTFAYDEQGNRILAEDSFGGSTTSAYDDAGRLVSRLFSAAGQPTLRIDQEYDAWGRITSQTRSSDAAGTAVVATSEYGYDFAGQVVTITHQDGSGATIADYAAVFDAAGQLSEETDHGQTHSYAYDQFGQLTQDGAASYSYDANGNRDGNGYVVGDGSRLLSDGEWNYSYDAEGNLVGKANIATGETWTFGYDHQSQLVLAEHRASASSPVCREVRFAYDAFGNRIEKEYDADGIGPLAAEVTRYALDGWKAARADAVGNEGWDVWAVLNGDGTLRERYLHGDLVDQVFARIAADGQAGWYLTDRLGSVRDVVNQQGAVVDTVRYDAFGNVVAETAPAARGMYGWTARQYDAETGLQYNRARYYDPQTGRWISQDPAGFSAGDSNLYRYVGNQVTTARDPSGLSQEGQTWTDWAASSVTLFGVQVWSSASTAVQWATDTASGAGTWLVGAATPVIDFAWNVSAGLAETVVPLGPMFNLPMPNTFAGGLGRVTGRLAGLLVGAAEVILGGGMMAGGGAVAVVTGPTVVGPAAGGTVAAGGAGLITLGVSTLINVITVSLNNPVYSLAMSNAANGGQSPDNGDRAPQNARPQVMSGAEARSHPNRRPTSNADRQRIQRWKQETADNQQIAQEMRRRGYSEEQVQDWLRTADQRAGDRLRRDTTASDTLSPWLEPWAQQPPILPPGQ